MGSKASELRIGLLFNFNSVWTGGLIYVINIIKALHHLPHDQQPMLILFATPENQKFIAEIEAIGYKGLKVEVIPPTKNRMIRYFTSLVCRYNFLEGGLIRKHCLTGFFPFNDLPVRLTARQQLQCKVISWLPDFQHRVFPGYFTSANRRFRELRFRWVFQNTNLLVLSSEAAAKDYNNFYKSADKAPYSILPFVSTIDQQKLPPFSEVKRQYALPDRYFLIANQFYRHKDHVTVFKALAVAIKADPNVHICCTGKIEDYRDADFATELRTLINNLGIETHLHLLGFISRADQLTIMQACEAVIQPSLFEGWSTVIEDAKTLDKPVIASKIDVHVEQLGNQGIYFEPGDEEKLALQLVQFSNLRYIPKYPPFEARVNRFAEQFVDLFKSKQ